ncbi:HNH endonuclease signature motif containing protein [Planotetraspora sp. A-T 1434]|uniref:HNH endonuclease signature motif containing protein n=1 Tax=Planotetraspora sp. A-T 1434 TaxID=2979219 RepID=UPI0039659258
MVARMHAGEWRFAICADDGHLLYTGITRRRPTTATPRPRRDPRRAGIVELQITHTRLQQLARNPASLGAWAPTITDLAHQATNQATNQATGQATLRGTSHATVEQTTPPAAHPAESPHGAEPNNTGPPPPTPPTTNPRPRAAACAATVPGVLPPGTGVSGTAVRRAAAGGGASGTGVSGSASQGAAGDRRRTDAALRRYVQIRGRVCSWPGCRVPATKTDQDHITDRALGGPTHKDNLELACRHDHRAKHQGGWQVTMPEPGLITWTSPLGHTYPTRLPPIMTALPDPRPRNWPDTPPDHIPNWSGPTMTSSPSPHDGDRRAPSGSATATGRLRAGQDETVEPRKGESSRHADEESAMSSAMPSKGKPSKNDLGKSADRPATPLRTSLAAPARTTLGWGQTPGPSCQTSWPAGSVGRTGRVGRKGLPRLLGRDDDIPPF